MKLLMLMRDALPPQRVDVAVLFGKSLRQSGIHTDFAGPGRADHSPAGANSEDCVGRQFDTGDRIRPSSLWRQLRIVWRFAGGYDAIVLRDIPLAAALLLPLAAWRDTPCIYWMSFPIPLGDRVAALDHWRSGRTVRAVFTWLRGHLAERALHRWALPGMAHVFVQSEAMKTEMIRSTGLPPGRFTAVPMGVDAQLIAAMPPSAQAEPAQSQAIVYLGSLDRSRQLDVLIDAFAAVLRQRPCARLWLIGSAPRESDLQWLLDHARRCGVDHGMVMTGAMPMQAAWLRVQQAAVGVSPIPPGPLHDVSSPTKIVEYLALGVPVVANDIPDQRLLLEACGGGLCVPFAAASFAQALLTVLEQPAAARIAARQAQPKVLALRSYDSIGALVAATLRGVVVVRPDAQPLRSNVRPG